MSEKKDIKKSIKRVWDRVKEVRRGRADLYAPEDIKASADQLATHAEELRTLANQLSTLSAMPPLDPPVQRAKRKTKPPPHPAE